MGSISFDSALPEECKSTLRETSRDYHDRNHSEIAYMTDSTATVYDIDEFKRLYTRNLKCSEEPNSVDALHVSHSPKVPSFLVEFKNGRIDRAKAYSVLKKAYDSLLMLADCCDFHISDTRDCLDFILVYNAKKNYDRDAEDSNPSEPKRERHYDDIVNHVERLALLPTPKFGLSKLEGYCFRNVQTCDEEEFAELLDSYGIG